MIQTPVKLPQNNSDQLNPHSEQFDFSLWAQAVKSRMLKALDSRLELEENEDNIKKTRS